MRRKTLFQGIEAYGETYGSRQWLETKGRFCQDFAIEKRRKKAATAAFFRLFNYESLSSRLLPNDPVHGVGWGSRGRG